MALSKRYSEEVSARLRAVVEAALIDKNESARQASMDIVGHDGLFRDIRAGRIPGIDKLQAISDHFGLELYFGPPRDIALSPETEVDGHRFATVARHDAQAAAGGGVINFDGPPIDHLAFSKTWLQQNGIQAGSCSLINAHGESMEPSIYDGDLIMIDHRRKQIRNRKVYVYNDPEQGTRIKRLETVPNFGIVVHSDNEDENRFPTEYHVGPKADAISQNIVGEVVWSGHKWV